MPEFKEPRLAVKAKDSIIKAKPTYVKAYPSNESWDDNDFKFSSEDLPLLVTRMDRVKSHDGKPTKHYEIELAVPIKGRYTWYVFDEHVEEVPLPEYFIQAVDATVIKRRLSGNLSPEDKFNFNTASQPLQANWIKSAEGGHFEFSLKQPINGVHNWFAFGGHVRASKVDTKVNA